jgi:hypothetical protein
MVRGRQSKQSRSGCRRRAVPESTCRRLNVERFRRKRAEVQNAPTRRGKNIGASLPPANGDARPCEHSSEKEQAPRRTPRFRARHGRVRVDGRERSDGPQRNEQLKLVMRLIKAALEHEGASAVGARRQA